MINVHFYKYLLSVFQ